MALQQVMRKVMSKPTPSNIASVLVGSRRNSSSAPKVRLRKTHIIIMSDVRLEPPAIGLEVQCLTITLPYLYIKIIL